MNKVFKIQTKNKAIIQALLYLGVFEERRGGIYCSNHWRKKMEGELCGYELVLDGVGHLQDIVDKEKWYYPARDLQTIYEENRRNKIYGADVTQDGRARKCRYKRHNEAE